jgi:cell division septum initiation protein DivIVA
MGINWWETDPALAGGDQAEDNRSLRERVRRLERQLESGSESDRSLPEGDVEEENQALREEVKRLERRLARTSKSDKSGND